ncbi:hypothetical protein [Sphingomonas alpina]|uniref:Uncharacterized protein n=1 Tax=Sphingomonas alpina TaxID=653931 RepID=A0A7H0LD42_9SPHN|nr:hypothetical protein [Sphingomonas alpina]QNQ07595.1 hypothetical protein H3Z74_12200 [Sphingomonas alpina]
MSKTPATLSMAEIAALAKTAAAAADLQAKRAGITPAARLVPTSRPKTLKSRSTKTGNAG